MLALDMAGMAEALAASDDQPWTAFDALARLADAIVGARLFTVMTLDPDDGCVVRLYSNMPETYPVSGKKPLQSSDWSEQVLTRHETFVANDIDAIAAVFPDHDLIRSLGCEAALNVPVVVGGRIHGTINCLDKAGTYTPERVIASEALKLPGAACFMLHDLMRNKGGR